MATFKVGDRVAYFEDPKPCGRVVATLEDGPAGARVRVRWDYGAEGEIAETDLVPCPEFELG